MPLSEDPRSSGVDVEAALKAYVLDKSVEIFARGSFFEHPDEPVEGKGISKTRYVQCDVILADLQNTRPPTTIGLMQVMANVDAYFQYRVCGPPAGPTKKKKVEVYRRDASYLRECWTHLRARTRYHRRAKDSQKAAEDADGDEDEGAEQDEGEDAEQDEGEDDEDEGEDEGEDADMVEGDQDGRAEYVCERQGVRGEARLQRPADEGEGADVVEDEGSGDDQECDEEAPDAQVPDSQETLMLGGRLPEPRAKRARVENPGFKTIEYVALDSDGEQGEMHNPPPSLPCTPPGNPDRVACSSSEEDEDLEGEDRKGGNALPSIGDVEDLGVTPEMEAAVQWAFGVPHLAPNRQREEEAEEGKKETDPAVSSASGSAPKAGGKVQAKTKAQSKDNKPKKPNAFNLFMKAKLNDHDFFPDGGHKVRFLEAVKEWNTTGKFLPQFNPKCGVAARKKVKAPKVDLTKDLATPGKKEKTTDIDQPSEEKTGAVKFGCGKCRQSTVGCRACNPAKAAKPPRAKGTPKTTVA